MDVDKEEVPLEISNVDGGAPSPLCDLQRLLGPNFYLTQTRTDNLWVYENGKMVNREIKYVPALYMIFDAMLLYAAGINTAEPLFVYIGVESIVAVAPGVYHCLVSPLMFYRDLLSSEFNNNWEEGAGQLQSLFSSYFDIEHKINDMPNLSIIYGRAKVLDGDIVALMKRRVVDLAGTVGRTVVLNEEILPVKNFTGYVNLYLQTTPNIESVFHKAGDGWEISVCLSDGQFQQVSFVNHIATIKGGTHVDYVTDQISNYIVKIANNKNANLDAHTVRNHLWVFLKSTIEDPSFHSQTRETLITPASRFRSKCELSDEFLTEVGESGLVDSLLSLTAFRPRNYLYKNDGTEKERVKGLDDAMEAGGRNSDKCTLILTEGYSCKALAKAGVSVLGRNYYGAYACRRTFKSDIQNIMRIIGLEQNKNDVNSSSLRYRHLMIVANQDEEGSRFRLRLIKFFYLHWPSLLKIPFIISVLPTPILEGVGTSILEEAKQYFNDINNRKIDLVWVDDDSGMGLAFKKRARKNLLRSRVIKLEVFSVTSSEPTPGNLLCEYQPGTHLDQTEKLMAYTDFVYKDLIVASTEDILKSIPLMVDGLNTVQRKVLFCSFKSNLVKTLLLRQFSTNVYAHSSGRHSEVILESTIIGMAQNFVGSNNINLLVPKGQFGSFRPGGKDHCKAKFLGTHLSPITRSLFPKDDDILLRYLKEDGESFEPAWYLPVIPTVLVNGCRDIGTGWRTEIPSYNPRVIIANIKRLLNDEVVVPMKPWYRGFKGKIEELATTHGVSYTATGNIKQIDRNTVRITELPVGRGTRDYYEFLLSRVKGNEKANHPFIEAVTLYRGDSTTIHFEVRLSEDDLAKAKKEGLTKKFDLVSPINTSNMYLFDSKGVIKKYKTPDEILQEFYDVRFVFYKKRKESLVAKLELELVKLDNKVRLIDEVITEKINLIKHRTRAAHINCLREANYSRLHNKTQVAESVPKESDDELTKILRSEGLDHSGFEYLLSMSFDDFCPENLEQLRAEREILKCKTEEMKKKDVKDWWLEDIAALESQLAAQYGHDEEEAEACQKAAAPKNPTKKARKAAAPKNPTKKARKAAADEAMEGISISSAMETGRRTCSQEEETGPEVNKQTIPGGGRS